MVLLFPLLPETAKSMKLKRNTCLRPYMVKPIGNKATKEEVQERWSLMFIVFR